MRRIDAPDLVRMRDQLLYDGASAGRKLTAFWVLLPLSTVIAAAGIATDSTATVIGAMIVSPLMMPILGAVLAIVTGDSVNLARSLGIVAAGAASVVAIAWGVGLLVPVDVVAETSSQVAGRVQPRLMDLLAAIATGAVGAFAVVRADVSATLPGVAIAISLVPPLAVVGLTLEAEAGSQALGALLLFLTNVVAILLSGLAVMAFYRVRGIALGAARSRPRRRAAVAVVVVATVMLAVPLGISGSRITSDALDQSAVADVAGRWAASGGWELIAVEPTNAGVEVQASGAQPAPSPSTLRRQLDEAGRSDVDVVLVLVPSERITLR
jgi:uncharacterized hydrophobic protein (TIGR00271 family)